VGKWMQYFFQGRNIISLKQITLLLMFSIFHNAIFNGHMKFGWQICNIALTMLAYVNNAQTCYCLHDLHTHCLLKISLLKQNHRWQTLGTVILHSEWTCKSQNVPVNRSVNRKFNLYMYVNCTGHGNCKLVSGLLSIILLTQGHHITNIDYPWNGDDPLWFWTPKVKGQVYWTLK
jgi:hypothetical protein